MNSWVDVLGQIAPEAGSVLILSLLAFGFRFLDQVPDIRSEIRQTGSRQCVYLRVSRAGTPLTVMGWSLFAASLRVWWTHFGCLYNLCVPPDDPLRSIQAATGVVVLLSLVNAFALFRNGRDSRWLGRWIPNILGLGAVTAAFWTLLAGIKYATQ